jgi:predicted permease
MLGAFFRRRKLEDRLRDELQLHTDLLTDKNIRLGMPVEKARREARIAVGGFEQVRERVRDARGFGVLEDIGRDFRYGLRQLQRTPTLAVVCTLTLALGIGANVAIFSLINLIFLKPLPVRDPERLVKVYHFDTKTGGYSSLSYPDYLDFRDTGALQDIAAYCDLNLSASIGGETERTMGTVVSANYFSLLGVSPVLGRTFLPGEDIGANAVTVLSYACWQRRFGGDGAALGWSVTLNGYPYTVIGVAPRGFNGMELGEVPEFWLPLSAHVQLMPSPVKDWNFAEARMRNRGTHWISATGRLKSGVSLSQAEAELQVRARQVSSDWNDRWTVVLRQAGQSKMWPGAARSVSRFFWLLFGICGVVLLIACVNVANLLLARATSRYKETAVRLALGANRFRLVRQSLAESLLLAASGNCTGLIFGYWLSHALARLRIGDFGAELPETVFDARVLVFCAAVSVIAAVLAGTIPALYASKQNVFPSLKQGLSDASRLRTLPLRQVLVVLQVSMSLVLLAAAGLLVRTMLNERAISLGFGRNRLLLASFDLGLQGYDEPRGAAFQRQLLERVSALPGVQSASLAVVVPLSGRRWANDFSTPEGAPSEAFRNSNVNVVGPGYFQAAAIPLVAGREFSPGDRQSSAPVAVVNEQLARDFWPGQSAIGKHLVERGSRVLMEVVGVVRDTKYRNVREQYQGCIYRPLFQRYASVATLYIRTIGNPSSLSAAMRAEVRGLDPSLPVFNVETMEQHLDQALGQSRGAAFFVGLFGVLALLLAAVGLYGVISFAATQRTQEIGIRLALGATRQSASMLVIRQGVQLAGIGLLLGLLLAFAFTRLLTTMLYGVSPLDALTFGGATLLLFIIAVGACYLPARSAAKADPLLALRFE